MGAENFLGQFLRARRGVVQPAAVGLAAGGRRRVGGLRREEVAMLAGVSVDYYVRLEQGRERHPSTQVVDALARTLQLDVDATAHLHELAGQAPSQRARPVDGERVDPLLQQMMAAWSQTPALVLGRHMAVLAHNALGRALLAGHRYSDDLVRLVFLDPDARDFYPDWDLAARNTVAALRANAGGDQDDPRLAELVEELSLANTTFRELWERHDVRQKSRETKRLRHPLVGEMTLSYESLTVNSAPGQQLVVYQAEAGSASEHALRRLSGIADTGAEPTPVRRTEALPTG